MTDRCQRGTRRHARAPRATFGLAAGASSRYDSALATRTRERRGARCPYWEQGLAAYDVAAGAVLVRQAGGRVTTWSGQEHHLGSDRICATNGAIHDAVLARICEPLG